MALAEGAGEEPGLSVEAGEGGVIPNEMVGVGNFCREIELGEEDLLGHLRGEMPLVAEARALGGGRAADDDHRGEMRPGVGFKKQREIDAEPAAGGRGCGGAAGPAGADGGMQNVFEFTAWGGMGKDALAEPGAIGLAVGSKSARAERGAHGRLDGGVAREQFTGALIGIEELGRQMAAKRGGEGRFAGGDAAGDAERGHKPDYFDINGRIVVSVTSGAASTSTTSSFSSSRRTGSPAGLMRRAETKMTRLRLRC